MQGSFESIGLLRRDLARRFKTPYKSVTFYAHLSLAVVLGGGAGIWYAIFQNGLQTETLAAALLTYFPALVAAAIIDFTHEREPYLRSFGLIAAGIFLVIFLAAVTHPPFGQLLWAMAGTILSITFWWLANGEKECFKDAAVAVAQENSEVKGLSKEASTRDSDGGGTKL
jgi:hypothetical protein